MTPVPPEPLEPCSRLVRLLSTVFMMGRHFLFSSMVFLNCAVFLHCKIFLSSFCFLGIFSGLDVAAPPRTHNGSLPSAKKCFHLNPSIKGGKGVRVRTRDCASARACALRVRACTLCMRAGDGLDAHGDDGRLRRPHGLPLAGRLSVRGWPGFGGNLSSEEPRLGFSECVTLYRLCSR